MGLGGDGKGVNVTLVCVQVIDRLHRNREVCSEMTLGWDWSQLEDSLYALTAFLWSATDRTPMVST